MSKPARNKKAKIKLAKSSNSRYQEKDEEIMIHHLMKFAEDIFDFDEKGNVIKSKYDSKGIKIEEEDPEIDPESIKEKEQKKIKVQKTAKKKINSNTGISFDDLLKKPE